MLVSIDIQNPSSSSQWDDSLIVSKSSLIELKNNNAFKQKSKIETQMQRQEEKVDMREAVDAGLVVTESSGTKPDKQDKRESAAANLIMWNALYLTLGIVIKNRMSNDMVHRYFLEDARKWTQDKTKGFLIIGSRLY
ncbi:hypothetical protein Tco_0272790 [Tanacetum coccineum]